MQKSVPALDENLSVENTPKLSAKFLEDKICKIKQIQNIPLTVRTFVNQLKSFLEKHVKACSGKPDS